MECFRFEWLFASGQYTRDRRHGENKHSDRINRSNVGVKDRQYISSIPDERERERERERRLGKEQVGKRGRKKSLGVREGGKTENRVVVSSCSII